MPPILALLACTVFVGYLLRQDARRPEPISPGLWVPTLWLLYVSSKPLASWFGAGGDSMEAGSPLDRSFQLVLLGVGCWMLGRRERSWQALMRYQSALTALLVYMAVSVVWSDIPFVSFKRWIRELLAIVMALLVATEPRPAAALLTLLRRLAYVLIPYSQVLIKYYPHLGVEYGRWSGKEMWIGVALQKNGLGLLCLLSTFYLVWSLLQRWQGRVPAAWPRQTVAEFVLLGLSLWMLKGPPDAYSATSVGALVLGVAGLAALERRRQQSIRDGLIPGIIAAVFIYGVVLVGFGGSGAGVLGAVSGRDTTLTGRTEIWAGLMPEFWRNPILGAGFGGFWTSEASEIHLENSAHSGYLDCALQLGLVGLVLTAAFVVSSARQAERLREVDPDLANFWICLLFIAMVHNATESSIDTFTRTTTALVLFFTLAFPAMFEEAAAAARPESRCGNPAEGPAATASDADFPGVSSITI